MKLTQFVHLINSFNPIDLKKKSDNQYGKSSHFKLNICNSCLCDKVHIFGQIFAKLTQDVYLINRFNPSDFQRNWTIGMGKIAILS